MATQDWLDDLFGIGVSADEMERRNAAHAVYMAECAAFDAQITAEDAARVAARTAQAKAEKCRKCGGSGKLPQFLHRSGGVCFRCDGTGRVA